MILDSLFSVALIIALGWSLKRFFLPDDASWKAFERVSYFVLNPALIFYSLVKVDLATIPFFRFGGALVAGVLTLTLLLLAGRSLVQKLLATDGPGFTSVFQGITRWNAFVALAIAGNLHGAEGIALTSVAIATMIPLLNVISVYVLQRHGSGGGSILRNLATNPFIVSAAFGILFNLLAIPLPRTFSLALATTAQCALGSGLLLTGVGLHLEYLQRPSRALVGGTLLRVFGAPLVAFGFILLFKLPPQAASIALICFGVPTASGAYLLARQTGGDAPLMAAIITAQTLVCMLTLPIVLAFLS